MSAGRSLLHWEAPGRPWAPKPRIFSSQVPAWGQAGPAGADAQLPLLLTPFLASGPPAASLAPVCTQAAEPFTPGQAQKTRTSHDPSNLSPSAGVFGVQSLMYQTIPLAMRKI
ncbi:hypothetical protein NDU88_004113 [Pleurodeles waltl]|uniref:Uncharacterized protein n=1 Tax=Pleurodeles waltl TaxID=8319 RepID=A0AAV7L3Q5_PLEWA|nr:hypothetical protein NDU88_004113 [Pleurodeles waltl]